MKSTPATQLLPLFDILPQPWHLRKGRRKRSNIEILRHIEYQLHTSFQRVGTCWIWTGQYWSNGYGRIARHRPNSRYSARAHIAAYQFYIGRVGRRFVCHTCDHKGCIRPTHLWLGTNAENQRDAVKKGIFKAIWTAEKRAAMSRRVSGSGNPMYGRRGKLAPCYGRTGKKHPMFNTHHSEYIRKKISHSLRRHYA